MGFNMVELLSARSFTTTEVNCVAAIVLERSACLSSKLLCGGFVVPGSC